VARHPSKRGKDRINTLELTQLLEGTPSHRAEISIAVQVVLIEGKGGHRGGAINQKDAALRAVREVMKIKGCTL